MIVKKKGPARVLTKESKENDKKHSEI